MEYCTEHTNATSKQFIQSPNTHFSYISKISNFKCFRHLTKTGAILDITRQTRVSVLCQSLERISTSYIKIYLSHSTNVYMKIMRHGLHITRVVFEQKRPRQAGRNKLDQKEVNFNEYDKSQKMRK